MKVFSGDDSWEELHEACWALAQEQGGFTEHWTDEAAPCPSGRKYMRRALEMEGVKTVGEGFATMAANPRRYAGNLAWAATCALHMLDPEQRRVVVTALAAVDPSIACAIYIRREDLTDEEDEILWRSFEQALPKMAERLKNGEVRRAKEDRSHG